MTRLNASPFCPSAGFHDARPSKGYGAASVKSIVSGQHEIAPTSRRPRVFAAPISSKSWNTTSGLALL